MLAHKASPKRDCYLVLNIRQLLIDFEDLWATETVLNSTVFLSLVGFGNPDEMEVLAERLIEKASVC